MILTAARGAWGMLLLARPPVADAARDVAVAARVLGARQLAQALLLARGGRRSPPRWAIAVDALHCASMLVTARLLPRVRRDALASAAIAGAFAAAGMLQRRSGER